MTNAPQISPEQQRFNRILSRIRQTEQGRQMCFWLNGWDISVKFSANLNAPAAYFGHNKTLPKDNKTKGGTLYLDKNAPDEFLMIGMFEEMRKAWHDKVARSDAPNRSPLCHIISRRFEEADALSFAACMVMEHTEKKGEHNLFAAMTRYEKYRPFVQTLSILSRYAEQNSFNRMRRAAFDTYFEAYMPDMAKAEGEYTKNFLGMLKNSAIDAEHKYYKSFYKDVDLSKPLIERFDTISSQDFEYYGMPGFAKEGENYLTAFKDLPPVKSHIYMLPTQPSYEQLVEFNDLFKTFIPHMNLLGSPYKLTPQDQNFLKAMAPPKPAEEKPADQKQSGAAKPEKRKKKKAFRR